MCDETNETLQTRKVHPRIDDTSLDKDHNSQQQEVRMPPHQASVQQLAGCFVVSVLVCIFIAWLSRFAWDNYSVLITEKETLQQKNEELAGIHSQLQVKSEKAVQEIKALKQNHSKEIDALKLNHTEEIENVKQNLSKQIDDLHKNISSLQQANSEQNEQLEIFEYRAKIYQKQVDLINTISGQIKNMDLCYLQLEKYCTLKKKEDREPAETTEMLRLSDYLNCINEITADYHVRIRKSFQNHTEHMLGLRKAQVDLLTKGNFTEMEAQQKHAENAPAETCSYICDLDPEEAVSKSATDNVFEIGWNLFKRFFY